MKLPIWTKPIRWSLEQLYQKRILSYVSELSRPYKMGAGIRVLQFTDSKIEIRIPSRWHNRDEHGGLHSGSLVTAAEHAGHLFWERHLDRTYSSFELIHVDLHILRRAAQSVTVRLQVPEAERERILFEARKNGETQAVLNLRLYAEREQLCAEVGTTWRLTHLPALSAGSVL